MRHTLFATVSILALLLSASFARGVEPDTLGDYKDSQDEARQMARKLVTEVLDCQLELFDCNRLTDLTVYGDILSMRDNVDGLIDGKMRDVVVLLSNAQRAPREKRDGIVKEARTKVREVVKTLSAERQKLLHRIQVPIVIDRAKRLLDLQSKVLDLTRSLPGIADMDKRETEAESVVQSQHDINMLYLLLVDELAMISGWEPPAGPAAADGLRMLRAHNVGDHIAGAVRRLESVEYKEAAAEQQAVIDGLLALVYQVGKSGGGPSLSLARLRDVVADLQRRQQRVHEQTQKVQKAADAETSRLGAGQREIHRDIGVLADELAFLPATKPHQETAKASALEATGAILSGQFVQALGPQKSVLASLAEIENQLRAAEQSWSADKTANQLAEEVKALMQLAEAMARIRAEHDQAESQVTGSPAGAAAMEKQVADKLAAERAKYASLPGAVVVRLDQARGAALEAAKVIPTGRAEAQAAVKVTSEALDHAHFAVKRAVADAERRALGVKIGELARAIDALERASIAERVQAVRARIAAASGGFDKEAAKKFTDEQQIVASVARDVAEGIKDTAPRALKELAEAESLVNEAGARVAQDHAKADAARQAAEEADKASAALAEATKLIRDEIVKTADLLDSEASKDLAALSKVAEQIDRVLAEAQRSTVNQLVQLEKAHDHVQTAQTEQLRAAGQEEAARAAGLINHISRAGAQQAAASAAIGRFARGEANSPLDAVNELQKVVDLAGDMAKEAAERPQAQEMQRQPQGDPLARALQELRQAAEAAVRSTLEGNISAVDVASKAAKEALDKVAAQAQREAAALLQQAARPLDAAAQQRVTGAAKAAAQLTAQAAPASTGQLNQAVEKSAGATKQIEANSVAEARKTQADVADLLKQAQQQIEAAKQELAEQAKRELAQQAAEAAKLAAQARSVDPMASSALKRAERAAQQNGKQSLQAEAAVQKNLEHAAANLESRRRELELDRKIAEAFKRLADQQQRARDELVALGPQLSDPLQGRKLSDQTQGGPNQPKAPNQQAGQKPQPSAPAQPDAGKQDGQSSPAGAPQPQLQKGGSPQPPGPPGESGQAPPGAQQPQPEQPQMPFSDKKNLDKAKQLTSALGDYIGAQEDLGDLAQKLAEQKKVANKAIKNALKEAAKLNPNLDRAPNEMFIPPAEQPIFEPSKKPRLPEQIAGSGAMPQQGRKEKGDTEGATLIPPQTQGPQNPPSTSGQAKDMNNPQVQNPPENGVNASTIVQTAPITSAPQPAAPPSAPGVFQPNEGAPKSATPSSANSPPPPGKGPQGQKVSKEEAEKLIAELEKKQKEKKKRVVPKPSEQQPPQPPKPLGDEFKPLAPEETAMQLAGKDAVKEAIEELKKHGELGKEEKKLLADSEDQQEEEEEVETAEVAAQAGQQQQSAPKEQPGETGTTPGDLGMGQGTPGKGVGGESTGNPTEDRPQKGNQHGRFDGKRPWAKGGPEDLIPKGYSLPPGFKPELKESEPEDPFALPEQKEDRAVTPPDVDPSAPVNFGGGRTGHLNKPGRRTADVAVKATDFKGAPWFAKLPPELRAAIQSTSKSRPPHGYEEKLRRYRESVD